jgi:hypothetical protein
MKSRRRSTEGAPIGRLGWAKRLKLFKLQLFANERPDTVNRLACFGK